MNDIFTSILNKDNAMDRMCKSIGPDTTAEILEKGKKAEVGEVREWKGQKMRKTANGWIPVTDGKQKSNQEEPSTETKEQPQDLATLARAASDSALKTAAQGPNEEVRIAAKRELERRKTEGSDVFEAPNEEESSQHESSKTEKKRSAGSNKKSSSKDSSSKPPKKVSLSLSEIKAVFDCCNKLNRSYDAGSAKEILGAELGYDEDSQEKLLLVIESFCKKGKSDRINFLKNTLSDENLEYIGI